MTIQNHGSYNYAGEDFTSQISLEAYGEGLSDVEQYLTLANLSDTAFEKLLQYFSHVDEDVVICMFGDHLPGINLDFLTRLYGKI